MGHDITDKVIWVVDTPQEGKRLQGYLQAYGFTSVSIMGADIDLAEKMRLGEPDILLIDLYPWSQITGRLAQDGENYHTRVVVMAPQTSESQQDGMAFGITINVLRKPFKSGGLINSILSLYGIDRTLGSELAQEAYAIGMNRLTSGAYERYVLELRRVLGSEPDLFYYFAPGACYLNQGKYESIIASFENKLHPDEQLERIRKEAEASKQDYLATIRRLKRIIKRQIAGAEHYVQLGKNYLGIDMIPEADESFDKAIQMEPDNISNRKEIGVAYLQKELYERAEKAFSDAIDLNPKNSSLYIHVAIALRKLGKYKEAIAIYKRAIKLDPMDEAVFFNLARALFESNRKKDAIRALKKAVSLDPEFTEAKNLLAEYQNG